jgi:2-C-methyl-D-erythritol 4-phosphate cytidylyltransferase
MDKHKKYALIVAGGLGERMQSEIPKQFMELAGIPVLMHCINAFYEYDPEIQFILVIPQSFISYWNKLCEKFDFGIEHQIVHGGNTRFQSVRNGLNSISEEGLVAIHDGVRPLVKKSVIEQAYSAAEKFGNAIPAISINESVRIKDAENNKPVDRDLLTVIQTPQTFLFSLIAKAYEQEDRESFTDDATVLESTGAKIHLIGGNVENIKITRQIDLDIARALLETN